MSDLKPVMVRLPPEVYEQLRASAFDLAMPPAVLARVLIKRQLDMQDESEKLEKRPPVPLASSRPRQRSGRSKQRQNKKRGKNKKRGS
jgi:hypothetical protein